MTPGFEITQVNPAERLVFGWANISVIANNRRLVVDLQNNVIDYRVLERAAYNFVLEFRASGEMHVGQANGQLVESVVITPEKLEVWGLPPDSLHIGWWVGFKVPQEVFDKVVAGVYKMFSILGKARHVRLVPTKTE